MVCYPRGFTAESYSIPQGVSSIGDDAFSECESLTEISIPDSVTSIGDYAFSRCGALTEISIPDSVTSIGSNPFMRCENLTIIKVSPEHSTLATINGVLFDTKEMKLICYPEAFTARAFSIPQGVTSIGDYAFFCCKSLTEIIIPDSVTYIGKQAFSVCKSLTKISIPDSVTSIGDYAFSECESLTEISIPDSVTSIGSALFAFINNSLTIKVEQGSYAAKYFEEIGLDYTYMDNLDWLNS